MGLPPYQDHKARSNSAANYVRHRPETTLLYQIAQEYWPEFQAELASNDKYLPAYVTKEFDEYLKCGRLEHGFLRVRCETCHGERAVAFSYLLGPTILFLLSRLTFPNPAETQDLVEYYSEVSSRLWTLLGIFYIYAIGSNVLLLDVPIWSSGPASQAFLAIYAIICSRVENRYIHSVGIVLLMTQLLWRGLGTLVTS